MDLSKLTTADKVILGSAILLLIAMFLPWYGFSEDDFSATNSGWSYFLGGWIPLILALVMAAQVAISRFSPQTNLPDPPLPWGQVHMIAGIAAAVILVLRLAIKSDADVLFFDFELDRKFGIFVAVVAGIGLAVGGFLKNQEGEAAAGPGSSAPPTPF